MHLAGILKIIQANDWIGFDLWLGKGSPKARQDEAIHAATNGVTGWTWGPGRLSGFQSFRRKCNWWHRPASRGKTSKWWTQTFLTLCSLFSQDTWDFIWKWLCSRTVKLHCLHPPMMHCIAMSSLHVYIQGISTSKCIITKVTQIFLWMASLPRDQLCPPASSVHNIPPLRSHLDSTH